MAFVIGGLFRGVDDDPGDKRSFYLLTLRRCKKSRAVFVYIDEKLENILRNLMKNIDIKRVLIL